MKGASALLALALTGSAHGFATIGSTTDCTYNNVLGNPIQSALNAGHTDIRLVGGLNYTGSLNLAGIQDIRIRGGYGSCAAAVAGLLPSAPVRATVIAGGNLSTGIHVESAPERRRVITLELVDVKPPAAVATSGSGIVAQGVIDLVLLRSRVSGYQFVNETGGQGGGVHLSGARLYASRSEISNNHARLGGGVYCEAGGLVELDPATLLLSNQAMFVNTGGHGGGIYSDGCTVQASGRTLPVDLGGSNGIIANTAALLGGAIFASGGTVRIGGGPYCYGPDPAYCLSRLAVIALNQAKYGGAFSLTDAASLEIDYANVSLNYATVSGGAIDSVQSNIRIGGLAAFWPKYDRSQCPEGICEQFNQNRAGTLGGAIYASESGVFVIDALLDNNWSPTGAVLYAFDSQSLLQQVLVRNMNEGADNTSTLVHALDGNLSITRASLILEPPTARLDGFQPEGNQIEWMLHLIGTSTQLERSIIADLSGTVTPVQLSAGATLGGVCNAHRGNNVAAALNQISSPFNLADVDGDGRYTPAAGGALLDRCTDDGLPLNALDIRGQPRVVLQSATGFLNPVDVGASERVGNNVFQDGFE